MSRYRLRRNDRLGSPLRANPLTRRSVLLGASCLAFAAALGPQAAAAAQPSGRRGRDGLGSSESAEFVMRDGWILRADDPVDLPPDLPVS